MITINHSMEASVDASDLGLAPGDYPTRLTADVPGRGETAFVRAGLIIHRGLAVGYEHEADDGFVLIVRND